MSNVLRYCYICTLGLRFFSLFSGPQNGGASRSNSGRTNSDYNSGKNVTLVIIFFANWCTYYQNEIYYRWWAFLPSKCTYLLEGFGGYFFRQLCLPIVCYPYFWAGRRVSWIYLDREDNRLPPIISNGKYFMVTFESNNQL